MILSRIGEQLDIPAEEIQSNDHLLMLGLDSVRLMTLVGYWQKQGLKMSFEDLAEDPTIETWVEKLAA